MKEELLTEENLRDLYQTKNLSKTDIARMTETTVRTVNLRFKTFGIKSRTQDLTGEEYELLKVIKKDGVDRHHKVKWLCQCRCGQKRSVNAASLIRGLTTSCGCVKTAKARRKGFEDLSCAHFWKMEKGAKERGLSFDITMEDVWEVFEKQDRKCFYSGLELQFSPDSNKPENQTASVDRIDSYKGYTKDNICIVHKVINLMKSHLKDSEFIAFCNAVAKTHRMENDEDIKRETSRTILKKIRPRSGEES